MKRKKILHVGEASYTFTGYATYANEILNRLYDINRYELAELASYGPINDSRDRNIRWRYYGNAVHEKDPRFSVYKSNQLNEFGLWRLDRTLLDFKPDIVFTIRDPWMDGFISSSPLRKYFHWAWMPTVDSAPQRDDWVNMFMEADAIFTYSEWAIDVLNKQSNYRMNIQGCTTPGVDLKTFCPITNKDTHRRKLGFSGDAFIIGTVMRNQKRKLYPDLFESFRLFLDKCVDRNQQDLANKTFLYCHTSYPDVGWPIPSLLREHKIGNKVIFTYICDVCKSPFCAFFQDAKTICPKCNTVSATLTSVQRGLTKEQLADVYKLFDVYIQYSICEGLGMPQVEAASCGVPVMAVDYSAMKDVVKRVGGFPLKVERMFRELETDAYRAMPDNDYCAETLYKFFNMSNEERAKLGKKARKKAENYYNWDRIAHIWADYFDSVQLTGLQGKWDAPLNIEPPERNVPENLTNGQFVEWLTANVMREPDKLNNYISLRTITELNRGMRYEGRNMKKINREEVLKSMLIYADNKVLVERARCKQIPLEEMDYIQYAHMKEKLGQQKK